MAHAALPIADSQASDSDIAERSSSARTLAFFTIAAIPLATGLGVLGEFSIAGFNYTGWLWLGCLLATGAVVLADACDPRGSRLAFPWLAWVPWLFWVWLSLVWGTISLQNVQTALQLTTPLVAGMAASIAIRHEEQLRQLLKVFAIMLLVLTLGAFGLYFGVLEKLGFSGSDRPMAMTLAFLGCMFLGHSPPYLLAAIAGWAVCAVEITLTGSRMAAASLIIPLFVHPRFALSARVLACGAAIVGGLAMFYSPVFQQRFFYSGQGTLADVLAGDIDSAGRFEAWPAVAEDVGESPWIGHGIGAVGDLLDRLWPGISHPHNDYLRILYDLGYVGMVIFAITILWQMVAIRRVMNESDGLVSRTMVTCWLGLVVFLVLMTTDNVLVYNLWYTNPLMALLGAAYGVRQQQQWEAA